MKTSFFKHLRCVAFALLTIIGFTGCIEESTVVKVKKDGSGVIHHREYSNAGAAMGALGGLGGGDAEDSEPDDEGPSEEELKAQAKKMGEGVTLKSLRKGKNKNGWKGYEAIFAFEDINKLKVEMLGKDAGDLEQPDPAGDAPDEQEKPELVEFEMKDGVLTITTPDPDGGEGQTGTGKDESDENDEGAADPFGGDGGGAQMAAMMGPMFIGARMGFFVEIDGEIAETNARHQNGNMLTILKVDLGKLFADQQALGKMDEIEGASREDAQKIADSIEGMDMDLQKPITVKFK
jgi:hypothetical protein